MDFKSWYTDKMTVNRVVPTLVGSLTKNVRTQIYAEIPCRVYTESSGTIRMTQTSASINKVVKVACDNSWDIHAGDELLISRGGLIGQAVATTRAFAGDPHYHFEPYGSVSPALSHQEIELLNQERV